MENKIILFIILFYLLINCINFIRYSKDEFDNISNMVRLKYKFNKILASF